MPISRKIDLIGPYYQYGSTGAKYYYRTGNKLSRQVAKQKAMKQMRAIKRKKF